MVDEAWVQNAYLPLDQQNPEALAVSNELTQEFIDSDYIVIGMPMYNWGVPASVKAWIDQIVRAGLTFQMTSEGIKGLADPHKKVIALVARNGRFLTGEPYEGANFQDPYLKGIMGFLGVKQVYVEALQDVFNHENFERDLAQAIERVKTLAKNI